MPASIEDGKFHRVWLGHPLGAVEDVGVKIRVGPARAVVAPVSAGLAHTIPIQDAKARLVSEPIERFVIVFEGAVLDGESNSVENILLPGYEIERRLRFAVLDGERDSCRGIG